jgi:site-specific DNA-adenine methylase
MKNYKKIIAIDKNKELIELLNYFKKHTFKFIEKEIEKIIKEFNLSNSFKFGYEKYNIKNNEGLSRFNKENYLKLRTYYNKTKKLPHLYILIIFGFNYQIRFNRKGEYNIPVGKGDFNKTIRENLKLFCENLKLIECEFICDEFYNLEKYTCLKEIDFVYCDPPYLLSKGSYNENGFWTEKEEEQLLNFLEKLNKNKIKFALSNITQRGENENKQLIKFLKKFKKVDFSFNYNTSNYQKKRKIEKEVLIKNY